MSFQSDVEMTYANTLKKYSKQINSVTSPKVEKTKENLKEQVIENKKAQREDEELI